MKHSFFAKSITMVLVTVVPSIEARLLKSNTNTTDVSKFSRDVRLLDSAIAKHKR